MQRQILSALLIAACCLAHTLPIHCTSEIHINLDTCHFNQAIRKHAWPKIRATEPRFPLLRAFIEQPLALRGGGTHDGGRKKLKKKKMMEEARMKRIEDEKKAAERIKKAKLKARRMKREER